MSNTNGYFQIILKNDGTYLKILPPIEGGEAVTTEEVSTYLNDKKMMEIDIKEINRVTSTQKNQIAEIKLSSLNTGPINEYLIVSMNQDKTEAIGRFYPPSSNGKLMTRQEIINDLVRSGIKYGVVDESIDHFLDNRQYCTNIMLAQALLPVEGKSAVIIYHFNLKSDATPKMNEDGSVDFHQIDIINHINKGDILATLEPADFGKPGIDICGNVLKPKKVVNKALRHGANIHLSEDGTKMYSDVSGHVSIADDKVFVSNTYEIMADVDLSTGNINYDGNVLVRGNVITGFSIKATGDIIVEGVVEGATLETDGQIVLKRGIQGANRGSLNAKGNIVAKFIENSEVNAGGYITTDAIMHSKVTAKGDIIVSGKRGLITGGEIRSGSMISLKTGGSKMGTFTLLEVGINPSVMADFRKTEQEIASMRTEQDKLVKIITLMKKKMELGEKLSEENAKHLRTVTQNNILFGTKINQAIQKCEELKKEIDNFQGGRIRVEGILYQGVKLIISNTTYYIRTEEQHCQFMREGADIKSFAI